MKTTKTQQANHCLVVIDLGNGEVKAKVKQGNSKEWVPAKFPSVVAESSEDGMYVDGKQMVIGQEALSRLCNRTGETDTGKIDNALPLLIHTLQETVGLDEALTVDVIFTCPSVKEYGDRIKQKLLGRHSIFIPADELTLTPETSIAIEVNKVVAQLEGHQAQTLCPAKEGSERYIVDIGNRTVLITCVNNTGRIVHKYRHIFNNCGVQSIARKIKTDEHLVGLNDAPMLPSPEQVIDYLFANFNKSDRAAVAEAIHPDVKACLSKAVEWVNERARKEDVVLLIGGGANIPGVADLFGKKAKVLPNSSWATVDGLLEISSKLIGAYK